MKAGRYWFPANDRVVGVSSKGHCSVTVSVTSKEIERHCMEEFDPNFQKFWSERAFGRSGAKILSVTFIRTILVHDDTTIMCVCEVWADVTGICKVAL